MNISKSTTDSSVLEHHECVAEAAVTIFDSMCGVELQPVGGDGNLTTNGVIIAIISIVGDVNWSVFIGLPRETAITVAEKFAGFEICFDSGDMGDAIGELANILAGQTKAILDRRGIKTEISLPSVIRAENLHVLIQHDTATEKVCFDSPLGKFWTGVVATNVPGFVA